MNLTFREGRNNHITSHSAFKNHRDLNRGFAGTENKLAYSAIQLSHRGSQCSNNHWSLDVFCKEGKKKTKQRFLSNWICFIKWEKNVQVWSKIKGQVSLNEKAVRAGRFGIVGINCRCVLFHLLASDLCI